MRGEKKLPIENVNLIRKIAWKFKKLSKEPFDDLFQEGYIGYLKALETYNPNKGAFSTHAWFCITSDIQDYLKSMRNRDYLLQPVEDLSILNTEIPHSDFFDMLPNEAAQIAEIICKAPKLFVFKDKDEVIDLIRYILEQYGWSNKRIDFGINSIINVCCI